MTVRESLEEVVGSALAACVNDGSLALETVPEPSLERPREESHGDWACTIAMRLAKVAHKNPREIAQIIVDHLPENTIIKSVDIAGPGFINFTLEPSSFQAVVRTVRDLGEEYGKSQLAVPCKVNLEYVSANPTGPMHVGHGRWAALGDSMARVMRHAGYAVDEEFYVNDEGNQMNVFADSLVVRYQQLLGEAVEMPEQSYGGAYVKDLAQVIVDADADKWLFVDPDERRQAFRERGYAAMMESVRDTLELFGTQFDTYFSEHSLFIPGEDGKTKVQHAFDAMNERGYIYEKDGATYFKSSEFGDEKDRAVFRSGADRSCLRALSRCDRSVPLRAWGKTGECGVSPYA